MGKKEGEVFCTMICVCFDEAFWRGVGRFMDCLKQVRLVGYSELKVEIDLRDDEYLSVYGCTIVTSVKCLGGG